MKVVIDGVEYVPKCEIEPLNDERTQKCLEVLTEMIYFNQSHKMHGLAWNAIEAIAPELIKLDDDELIYNKVHGETND